ncbi:DUF1538 domain-containing protein [Mongoliitalea daihaiensis]|uniref:DUF1538 domain-containing protein n=1 Tax=Mongoliitalea daihaiensis TaxID=2782006 RepID=UPI001F23EC1E|nr:DUF1538 domain-containing protein [Mongoliitalea daihaiensis]UJP64073.1 DUF1538 domain-containing protein [Mongoliitalea daihaiensis]
MVFFDFSVNFFLVLWTTILDVAPVVLLFWIFQYLILRRPLQDVKKVVAGLLMVILGLTFFLIGLEKALFPIGEMMAFQLSDKDFIASFHADLDSWTAYYWVYIFAACIGFATTIAEPSLIAVAIKANAASGGTISTWGLRVVVALGVAFALTVGTIRIVVGIPLYIFIIAGYLIVMIQTIFAPKSIIALAYDSGGVTTSTVTVPIVASLGIGLASVVPGRDPAVDGFGLIALASLFPIISVLVYAQILELVQLFKQKRHEV